MADDHDGAGGRYREDPRLTPAKAGELFAQLAGCVNEGVAFGLPPGEMLIRGGEISPSGELTLKVAVRGGSWNHFYHDDGSVSHYFEPPLHPVRGQPSPEKSQRYYAEPGEVVDIDGKPTPVSVRPGAPES